MGSAAFRVITEVHSTAAAPATYSLGIFPNPFIDKGQIDYTIGALGHVRITLYDVLGRNVSRIVDGERGAGNYTALFHGEDLPVGIYYLMLQSGSYREIKKIALVK